MDDRTSLPGIKPAGRIAKEVAARQGRSGWIAAKARRTHPQWGAADDALRTLQGAVPWESHTLDGSYVVVPPKSFSGLALVLEEHERITLRQL